VVIGGGPAGLEAARVAAERGHRVTLFERSGELGGNALVTARQPGREEMLGIPRWLAAEVRRLGVEVRLNVQARAAPVLAERPDAVVLATGATPTEPAADGAGIPVVSAWSVLSGSVQPGRSVLVVDHTGMQTGCAVAELVVDGGGRAEVVSRQFHPAIDFGLTNTVALYRRLFRKGVILTAHHDLRRVSQGTATLFNYYSGEELPREGLDMVVIVTAPRPDDRLLAPLRDAGLEVYPVGDCVAPRDIEYATYDGHAVGRAL
jgi:NADPH-dependent 2,4-dienoyl-CoA reductase/sulfur reductase-like enzyme